MQTDLRVDSLTMNFLTGDLEIQGDGKPDVKICRYDNAAPLKGNGHKKFSEQENCIWLSSEVVGRGEKG